MTPEQITKEAITSPIYQLLKETPLNFAPRLSNALGRTILLKREDMHPIFSFKVRGACNKILRMSPRVRDKGVVAASAGNHAQGVAFAAKACKVPVKIYMPSSTPSIKIDAVRSHGAEIDLQQTDFNSALKAAAAFAKQNKRTMFHPYDDYDIICGQATAGLELLRAIDEPLAAVFIGCGGGGLLAGIAAVFKHLRPEVKIIGVEPNDAASMTEALRRNKIITLPYVGMFADTAAVPRVGVRNFKLCRDYVDDMITVDTRQMCNAIKEIYEDTRVIVEAAGALSVAGARVYSTHRKKNGKALVAVISGANMNFDVLRYVIENSSSGDTEEMLLAAEIPETPGSFLTLCKLLGNRIVTEFNYRYSTNERAHIFAGISLKNASDRKAILATLRANGIKAIDMTKDETAVLHVRHMVGGRSSAGEQEQTYRLEFPEKPGVLQHFLQALHKDWNISLFHYRFHGANVGRVLIGLQVPDSKRTAVEQAFRKINYPFWRVENCAAYDMFLANHPPQ